MAVRHGNGFLVQSFGLNRAQNTFIFLLLTEEVNSRQTLTLRLRDQCTFL